MKKVRSKLRPTEIGVIKTFSLSPNDEIGEIAVECSGCTYYYNNLAELCEKWEDYEEPKVYYYISDFGAIRECEIGKFPEDEENRKQIGNYFETREEAEKAVERLRAWKRLKDKGFRFVGFEEKDRGYIGDLAIYAHIEPNYTIEYPELDDDLDLLFGGEE